jgi:hypothetical protein
MEGRKSARLDPSKDSGYQSSGSQRVTDGMTVYDMNGEKIGVGRASSASADYFTLEKGMLFHHDYCVPVSAVSRLDPDGGYLNVAKDDIKNRGWENPPITSRDTLDPNEPRL